MKTPPYVPSVVKTYLTNLIEGNGANPGLASDLERKRERLKAITREIAVHSQVGQDGYLDKLRRKRAQVADRCDRLEGDLQCLRRLLDSDEMRAAYRFLIPELREDREWIKFFHAAWQAKSDYAKYRDRLSRAKKLTRQIAGAAADLARLLREYENTGMNGPPEFFSTRALLRNTDSKWVNGGDQRVWKATRFQVLGDSPVKENTEGSDVQEQNKEDLDGADDLKLEIQECEADFHSDSAERIRRQVRNAWGVAPILAELLDTVSQAANDFVPTASGKIRAAIASREHNVRTEYLRAFGNLLARERDFKLSPDIKKAMAIAATVVINDPDIVVTYEDVRKTLKKEK